jgi:hypothetical protein
MSDLEKLFDRDNDKEIKFVVTSTLENRSECVDSGKYVYLIHDENLGQHIRFLTRAFFEQPSDRVLGYHLKATIGMHFLKHNYLNLARLMAYAVTSDTYAIGDYLDRTRWTLALSIAQEIFVICHEISHFGLKRSTIISSAFREFVEVILPRYSDYAASWLKEFFGYDYIKLRLKSDVVLKEEIYCDSLAFTQCFGILNAANSIYHLDINYFPSVIAMLIENIYLLQAIDNAINTAIAMHKGEITDTQDEIRMTAAFRHAVRKFFLSMMNSGAFPTGVDNSKLKEMHNVAKEKLEDIEKTVRDCFPNIANEAFRLTFGLLSLDRNQDVPGLGPFNRKFEADEKQAIHLRDELADLFIASGPPLRMTDEYAPRKLPVPKKA